MQNCVTADCPGRNFNHLSRLPTQGGPRAGEPGSRGGVRGARLSALSRVVRVAVLAVSCALGTGAVSAAKSGSAWPGAYTVELDNSAGVLRLRTEFYTVEHDLTKGGAISRITLHNGRAANLLVRPIESRVRDHGGVVFSDLQDSRPKVTHTSAGLRPTVTVDSLLTDTQGNLSNTRVRTTYEYRWGYVKVRKEFLPSSGALEAAEVTPFATVLAPSLSDYGYREGISEQEGAPAFSFGSNRWGKLRPGNASDKPMQTSFPPRSMIFADPGVEGIEWFVGSDLAPWEMLAGRRGQGRCVLEASGAPPGLALSVSAFWSKDAAQTLTNAARFTYYLAVPLLEGRAHQPWLHTSFNRNRGGWTSAEQIRGWADQGIQTVHCHNDGDYYDDGLFWRDGSYPPYPDMTGYDNVLRESRRLGIQTATYFSNKELHPSTTEFKEHGDAWARKNLKGGVQHNFFRGQSEFGAQMCLRSGWLEFLKMSIDRVLKNHPLDGVYYDWNVALYCCNPLHEGKGGGEVAQGHWDIDELLDLMEWTRSRVGPDGLVIVHNTTTPSYAAENFADHIVATEWGYKKWTDRAPGLAELPLEWSLAGARSRGVISYGTIASDAPRRLHRLFAMQAFLGGVAPWPTSPETFELIQLLKLLGDIESYRFVDWRNEAATLSDNRCASAIYSRKGQAWVLLANMDAEPREVTCVVHPDKLPFPIEDPTSARRFHPGAATPSMLDISGLLKGLKIPLKGDEAILIEVRE